MNRRSKRILDLARDKSLADMTPSSSDNSQIISDSEYKLPEESEAESSWECGYRESDFFLDRPIELRQELPDSTYTTMQTIQPGLPPEENNSVDHNYCVSLRQNDNLDSEVKTPGKTRRVRRKHQCLYCNQDVGNFLRHMERNHWDEFQVQEILSLEKKSKKRIKLIDKLRKEGDFSTSNIVPVMANKKKLVEDYIVCKFCQGYYAKNSLRRHAKKCFFNPDPSQRFQAQIEGQTVMVGNFGPNDPLKISGLINMLRADETSLVAKKDQLICEVGRRYIKSHKEKHLLVVAKRNMRRLARLLISVRTLKNNKTLGLAEILLPKMFKILVLATRNIAEYDVENRSFKSPSLALQMGTLIKHAVNTACSIEIQKENPRKNYIENFKELIKLIDNDWAIEVSSEAGQNLAYKKFNKPTLIHVAEDIKKLDQYLKNLISQAKLVLAENDHNEKAYRDLLEGIFCSVMIFNKRWVGELQNRDGFYTLFGKSEKKF
ncbi:uncharacterized protein LOC132708736 [Cylas formicarius]|uniref:uncharacterized protein LOC132708736 n=1 Tax=Cylas formicarius TaxID=197179 RepID=UPI0029584FC5|nr:uncharacterized protein LOC132708736 [Cylas formicarius]